MAEPVIATSQDKAEPDLVRAKAFEDITNFQIEHPEVYGLLMEAAADKTNPDEVLTSA